MKKTVNITLQEREKLGKKAYLLRDQGILPGVINEARKDSTSIKVDQKEFEKVYSTVGRTQPIEYHLGDKKHLGMIKELEREPVKGQIIHFTIQAVNANQEITADVPVHLNEEVEIPAKKAALDVISVTHSIEVRSLPHDIPEEFLIDGSGLVEIGDRILVSDVKMPEGVVVAASEDEHELNQVLFIVEEPRVTSEEDLAEDTGSEDTADVPSEKGGDDAGEEGAVEGGDSDKDAPKEDSEKP